MITLALLAACIEPAGTSVGNPGFAVTRAADSATVSLSKAELPVFGMEATSCTGATTGVLVDRTLDVRLGEELAVPAGELCTLVIELDGPLVAEGTGQQGGLLTLELEADLLTLGAPGLTVDGQRFVLELASPDWLDADELDLEDGEDVTIRPGSPEHDLLVLRLRGGTSLYDDDDEDGEVDEGERSNGAEAEGDDDDQD